MTRAGEFLRLSRERRGWTHQELVQQLQNVYQGRRSLVYDAAWLQAVERGETIPPWDMMVLLC